MMDPSAILLAQLLRPRFDRVPRHLPSDQATQTQQSFLGGTLIACSGRR